MNKKLWLNDGLVSYDEARISPLDRGFTLGDGLFETMRVRDGEILRLERHLSRLQNGAGVIGLSLPWTDDELAEAIGKTLSANGLQEAFVRLTVSRGVPSVRGLLPDKNAKSTLLIQAEYFAGYPAELYQRGMHVTISSVRRNEYSPLSSVKSLNYLENILARQEAAHQGVDDALMLNTAGELICASAANLFFVQGNILFTAPFSAGVLPGTMRAYVIEELAPVLGLRVVERAILPTEINAMDEAFLTNALMGVMPLTQIDGKMIMDGKSGKFTRELFAAF